MKVALIGVAEKLIVNPSTVEIDSDNNTISLITPVREVHITHFDTSKFNAMEQEFINQTIVTLQVPPGLEEPLVGGGKVIRLAYT